MENNFHKAYKEVLEVLKYMSKEDVDKIPKDMILTFEKKQDKNHSVKIDVNKELGEQKLLEETKDILSNIFRDYWATQEQKEKIIARENFERDKIESEKREKYNPNKIFEIQKSVQEDEYKTENNKITVLRSKSWSEKVIGFFKSIFRIK